jgi:hypothetical protein
MWSIAVAHRPPADIDSPTVSLDDLIACLSGRDDVGLPRDAWGVPVDNRGSDRLDSEPAGKRGMDQFAAFLSAVLPRWRDVAEPRWPGGASFAVSITHDVDLPYRFPPWRLQLARARLHTRKGALAPAVFAGLAALRSAYMSAVGRGPASPADDQFSFDAWREAESALDARSAFYVSVTPTSSSIATPQDVTYDARAPRIRDAIRRAAASGWEIGLHASIRASRVPGRLAEERHELAGIAGVSEVAGVRHHFWCLPGDDPWLGWREHRRAGFRYDSSLGLNDVAAYRWSWPWPFFPWNPGTGSAVEVLQVPPLVMDAAVARPGDDSDAIISRLRSAATSALAGAGVLMLDWHLEQFSPRRLHGAGPALLKYLAELRHSQNAWWATPAEIADWWIRRDARLWLGESGAGPA